MGAIERNEHEIMNAISKLPVWLCSLLLVPCLATGQDVNSKKQRSGCSCSALFAGLVHKLEADYVGYKVAIKGKDETQYSKHKQRLSERAERASLNECILVLQDFVRFFRDGHLFVSENPELSDEDVARLTSSAEQTGRNEDSVRRQLAANLKRLDPIEGIWYDKDGHRFGIIRDRVMGRRDFVAILLSEGVDRWQVGQVKAEFRKLPDGSYTDVFYSGRHYPLHLAGYLRGETGGAALRRNGLLLHMPPITWGKAFPLRESERGTIDTSNPRRPTIRFLDQTTVVSIPSHSPEYAPLLKELIEKSRERILKSENLIVDVRGDEGGSSWMTNVLMPFIVTAGKRPNRYWVGDHSMVLSSPDNISYFAQMKSQGWIPEHLVERMQANPGKVVSFADPSPSQAAVTRNDVSTVLPRNVAILMDRAVVSAGEAFIIEAMRNEKVTLFGENTGGVIDYQSVTLVPIADCASAPYLGYPTSAASDRLPVGGVNATGIPPHVRIPDSIADPVAFIISYYKRHPTTQPK